MILLGNKGRREYKFVDCENCKGINVDLSVTRSELSVPQQFGTLSYKYFTGPQMIPARK